MYLQLVTFAICLASAIAFPEGAPTAACQNLTPQHGGPLPFDVPVEAVLSTTTVNAGSLVSLQLRSLPGTVFGDFWYRGFMVQARIQDGTGRVLGFFETGPGVRYVDCPQFYASSTVTHTAHNDKNLVNINWRAPTNIGASSIVVRFHFTIVMNVGLFWANEVSAPITVLNH